MGFPILRRIKTLVFRGRGICPYSKAAPGRKWWAEQRRPNGTKILNGGHAHMSPCHPKPPHQAGAEQPPQPPNPEPPKAPEPPPPSPRKPPEPPPPSPQKPPEPPPPSPHKPPEPPPPSPPKSREPPLLSPWKQLESPPTSPWEPHLFERQASGHARVYGPSAVDTVSFRLGSLGAPLGPRL
jgi:hypothetical protein